MRRRFVKIATAGDVGPGWKWTFEEVSGAGLVCAIGVTYPDRYGRIEVDKGPAAGRLEKEL